MTVAANVLDSSSDPKKTSAFAHKAVEYRLTTFGVCEPPEFLDNRREVKGGCE